MKNNNHIQKFQKYTENNKVTKIGQKFKLNQPMKNDNFWKEGKIYTCTNIIKFNNLDNEIYVDNNWISDSFTTVITNIDMKKETSNLPQNEAIQYEPLLAVVNSSAIETWLEPYIGTSFEIVKKGYKVLWFNINYGTIQKRKADVSLFNYC